MDLLDVLESEVFVPPAVSEEVLTDLRRPGAVAVGRAIDEGTISVVPPSEGRRLDGLRTILDHGEAEVIALAIERGLPLILMDDKAGRRTARRLGVVALGTAGLALLAHRRSRIADLAAVLDDFGRAGLFLSPGVRAAVLAATTEGG